ncbi:nucleotidyltransferase family protein [Cellulosimicrobium cellulans]|uniref:nucleotidyltransferase family protein n=1 Tax=Cellulosimicrobium cellulans TaxID=1710 RepID=UPI0028AA4F97|nr:nucleotidyltransferase family protein [Cellulosimicrobium cellulans]
MTVREDARLRPLAGLLLDAVRGAAVPACPPGLRGVSPAEAVAAGRLHRVTPAVERVARAWPDEPEGWRPALEQAKHDQLMRHLRALADVRAVGAVLDAASVPWVAVKGPVLAGAIWPAVNMREYYDVDLVVAPERFKDSLALLQDRGVRLLDRNWPALRRSGRAELAMVTPAGTPLDLHWHVAVPADLRRELRIDMAAMLERRRLVGVGGQDVPTLDPVDTVLHLAFHAAQSGANRLMWLADVRFALDHGQVDVAELERRARASGTWLGVRAVLDRADRVLGLAPDQVPRGATPAWLWLARARDARRPFPGLPGDPALGGNEYSAARRGVLDSSRVLVHHHLAARREGRRHDAGLDERRPLQADVPDARARASYFDAVARETAGHAVERSSRSSG